MNNHTTEALINTTTDLMWSISSDFKLVAANNAFLDFMKLVTGLSLVCGDEVMLKGVFSEAYLLKWDELYRRSLAGESVVEELLLPAGPNNKAQWFETTLHPIIDGVVVTGVAGYSRNISLQKERDQHLKLLESVITNTTDAVMVTEAEPFDEPGHRIVYVNEAFTRMTGYSAAEVLGKTPRILQGPLTDKNELKRFGDTIRKWQPCELTIINYKKNGEPFWINFTVSPVANEKGWYTHWISIEKDVTDRKLAEIHLKELNENLKRQTKELERSNAELEQFAYVASHDLQEPLRMVTSFLTQLEKKYAGIIDEKGKLYVGFAVDGAKRMRQIILDLLEYSRVGRTEDRFEQVDPAALVAEVKILCSKKIQETNAIILVNPLPHVIAHKSTMRQVFQNLISNALKYTRANVPPIIEISSSETATHWQFSVVDNGIGIAEEYFEKVFVLFQRLHPTDGSSGTGMGLSVTKKIIESLDGQIWLTSEEGAGSTFHFTIKK